MGCKTVGFVQTTESITTSAAEILAENPDRKYLLLQNNGDGIVYLNFSTTATAGNGIKLDPGDAYEPDHVPSNAISAIGSAAATVIAIEA